jgi:hypothetical protein
LTYAAIVYQISSESSQEVIVPPHPLFPIKRLPRNTYRLKLQYSEAIGNSHITTKTIQQYLKYIEIDGVPRPQHTNIHAATTNAILLGIKQDDVTILLG